MTRIGLDTNILVYLARASASPQDLAKTERASAVLDRLRERAELVVSVQALGELITVLRRNAMETAKIEVYVSQWSSLADNPPSTITALETTLGLASHHRLQFWDSLIIAASAEAGCGLLFSEDMQDGFAVGGLVVVNPLLDTPHRALARLLDA